MAQRLVVLIPTAGRAELLARTLTSLAASNLPDIYHETIVVENGPKGRAEEIVRAIDSSLKIRYEYIEHPGKSNALNVTMRTLPDDCLIYMTDDDIRFDENALWNFARAAKGTDCGVFFGGAMDVDYETVPPKWLQKHLPADTRPFGQSELESHSGFLVFLGCNWAAYAGDLRRAGGFDTRFGPGGTSGAIGQESEMQQRLLRHGTQSRFVPDATVWHYVPAKRCSPKWLIHRQYRYGILDAIHNGCPKNRFRIPYWHIRKLIRLIPRHLMSRFSRDEEKRFLAKRNVCFQWGQVRGAWQSARQTTRSNDAFKG